MARALEWLSGFSKTAVVVNSRTDIVCEHAEHVRIGNLDSAPAVELLREMCKEPSRQWKPDVAQQLAQLCEHKALLLVTVGSLVGAGLCTVQVMTCSACAILITRQAYLSPADMHPVQTFAQFTVQTSQ